MRKWGQVLRCYIFYSINPFMTRPLRIQLPHAVYHITSRGNGRGDVFLNDKDREQFLGILSKTVLRYYWVCHTYCLMDNHYHLLLETPKPTYLRGCAI